MTKINKSAFGMTEAEMQESAASILAYLERHGYRDRDTNEHDLTEAEIREREKTATRMFEELKEMHKKLKTELMWLKKAGVDITKLSDPDSEQ